MCWFWHGRALMANSVMVVHFGVRVCGESLSIDFGLDCAAADTYYLIDLYKVTRALGKQFCTLSRAMFFAYAWTKCWHCCSMDVSSMSDDCNVEFQGPSRSFIGSSSNFLNCFPLFVFSSSFSIIAEHLRHLCLLCAALMWCAQKCWGLGNVSRIIVWWFACLLMFLKDRVDSLDWCRPSWSLAQLCFLMEHNRMTRVLGTCFHVLMSGINDRDSLNNLFVSNKVVNPPLQRSVPEFAAVPHFFLFVRISLPMFWVSSHYLLALVANVFEMSCRFSHNLGIVPDVVDCLGLFS